MPDDLGSGSLSPRAQEILRRADEQVAVLRRARALPDAGGETAAPAVAEGAVAGAPPYAGDPQRLMDRVRAGLDVSARHLALLGEALEAISQSVGDQPAAAGGPAPLPAPLAAHTTTPDAAREAIQREAEPVDSPPPATAPGAAYDAARLVAIEMAVAGETRESAGRRLREEFGIAEPRQILDDVFGPGTGEGSRMPWGGR